MAASMRIKTQACSWCRTHILFKRKIYPERNVSTTCTVHAYRRMDMDSIGRDTTEQNKSSFKGHPGVMTLPTVNLPERLHRAAHIVTEKFPVNDLKKRSQQLNNYLHSRKIPVEDDVIHQSANNMRNRIIEEANWDMSAMGHDERDTKESQIKKQVFKKLRSNVYHWKAIKYDAPTAVTYLHSRLVQNYSVFLQCLVEIFRREPLYVPRSMFDFGSGLSSSIWACHHVWGQKVFEYYCVDASRDMNTLARLLLQDGEDMKQMQIPGVYFRQFVPSAQQNKFSLVVCGHSLLELGTRQERLDTVLLLWKMTEDFLVLIDNGSIAGFNVINEAKEYILSLANESSAENEGHVFAPCPHDLTCPKLSDRNVPCMFNVTYRALDSSVHANQSVRYSYVILRKGKRKSDDVAWPRIIQDVTPASKHIHCHLCAADGTLTHHVLTAKKHGKDAYQCCRASKWGDLFPIPLPESTLKHPQEAKCAESVTRTENSGTIADGDPHPTDTTDSGVARCVEPESGETYEETRSIETFKTDTETYCVDTGDCGQTTSDQNHNCQENTDSTERKHRKAEENVETRDLWFL